MRNLDIEIPPVRPILAERGMCNQSSMIKTARSAKSCCSFFVFPYMGICVFAWDVQSIKCSRIKQRDRRRSAVLS